MEITLNPMRAITGRDGRSGPSSGHRITLLISSLAGGGAEGVCVTLANGFAERGCEVELVVLTLRGSVVHKRLKPEVRLVNLAANNRVTTFIRLLKYMYSRQPARILAFNHRLAVLLTAIRGLLRLDSRIIARNITILTESRRRRAANFYSMLVFNITKRWYENVDAVIAQSQGMRDDLMLNFGVSGDRVVVINNPLRPEIEAVNRKQCLSGHRDLPYLLYAGRLVELKGVDLLIDAFAAIASETGGLRLKIVGTGRMEHQLRQRATQRGVDHRVDFEGFQENMAPYYAGASATVLASLYEGFPNVLAESIALGTPVVAFDCPCGPREIVIDGRNGYLVRYKDCDHLVECIREAISRNWDHEDVSRSADRFRSSKVIEAYLRFCFDDATSEFMLASASASSVQQ